MAAVALPSVQQHLKSGALDELTLTTNGSLLERKAESLKAAGLQRVTVSLDALDDTIFTLKLTPNLAHCLSVYGIAREVSALTGSPPRAARSWPS